MFRIVTAIDQNTVLDTNMYFFSAKTKKSQKPMRFFQAGPVPVPVNRIRYKCILCDQVSYIEPILIEQEKSSLSYSKMASMGLKSLWK